MTRSLSDDSSRDQRDGSKSSAAPANAGRDHDGRWRPGTSGNPRGKRPGTRHHASRIAQDLLDSQVAALAQKCVELALEGDSTALRLCVERLLPARKETPVTIDLPELTKAGDAVQAIAVLIDGVVSGELLPTEAKTVGTLIEQFTKAAQIEALAERLAAVEKELRSRT